MIISAPATASTMPSMRNFIIQASRFFRRELRRVAAFIAQRAECANIANVRFDPRRSPRRLFEERQGSVELAS
jgi:hypothetical protein